MASIVHPNLALIFGAETWRGTPMLIFEYLEGGTLADRLMRAPFSLRQTLELGVVLARVLETTHAAGILHRDIKPSNIGYTAAEIPKLLDFGLAHVLNDSARGLQLQRPRALESSLVSTASLRTDDLISITLTNHVVGTPVYLSPEAVQNKPPNPTFDLWAVAIVLYEALAGRNPMTQGDLKDTLAFISRGVVPDIRDALPNCAPEMAIFLNEALATDIALRPSTAGELRSKLERLISMMEQTR
jgi:serine/threonine protein kinase